MSRHDLGRAARPVLGTSVLSRSFYRRAVVGVVAAFAGLTLGSVALEAQVTVGTLAGDLDGGVGGVAVDALGYVYVADFGERVWKISPFGDVEVLVDSLYGTSGNTIDAEGNLLQASFNANLISKIARDGTVTTLARGLAGPVGIALDADGNAIVCNCRSNSLAKVTPEGEVSELVASDLLNCPNGITRAASGDFYVVNFSDARMLRVTPEGVISEFAVIPGGGNGHVVAAGGSFFVTGFRSNKIYQVTADGEVSVFAGTGSFEEVDGEAATAGFSSPNGIAFSGVRRTFYVNDYLTPFSQRQTSPRRSSVRKLTLPTLTESLDAAMAQGGVDAAVTVYRSFKAQNPGGFTMLTINAYGYRLLQAGEIQAAIRIFELNTEDYPQQFNSWDSLAEGYKVAGDKEKAVRYYRKSLELNPANTNAVAMLEELGVEP